MESILISLLIICILLALFYYVINALPLPGPIKQVATVIIVVLFCLWLVHLLLSYQGTGVRLL